MDLIQQRECDFLDRDFLESGIATYNRLAEYARGKQQYETAVKHLRRALLFEVPPDDWPLKILMSKTQVNIATMLFLQKKYQESIKLSFFQPIETKPRY